MSNQKTIETLLCRVTSQVLFKDESDIDLGQSFAEQGGDDLKAIFLAAQCRDVGLIVDIVDVSLCETMGDLARKLVETNPQLPSSEADKPPVLIPFTQLQSLYNTAGLCQALIWDVKVPMSHSDAVGLVERLVERHPVLGASLDADHQNSYVVTGSSSSTTASPFGSLVAYESNQHFASQFQEVQREISKSEARSDAPILKVLFGGDESQITKIGLAASSGALDAHSWDILLQDIQTYSSRANQCSPQQRQFSDWIDAGVGVRAEQSEEFQPTRVQERDVGAVSQELSESSKLPPQNLPNRGAVSTYTLTLDLESTESLFGDKCHRSLRTEAQDLIFASLASSFYDQLPGPGRYLEIRDGRPPDDGNAWDTVIGCFDELDEVNYCGGGDVLNAARCAKDGRRRSRLSSVPTDTCRRNLIFDTTKLRHHNASRESLQPADDLLRQDVGELLVQALGGVYALPFWTDRRLGLLLICSVDCAGEAELQANSENFTRHLHETVVTLADSGPRLTLSDFPHISLDYSALDRLYEQKLRHMTNDPFTEIDNIYPCSPVQENMLVGSSLGKGAYMCTFTVKVSTSGRFASCDADSWVAAWNKVIDKHSSLRTIFVESEGRQGHFDQVVLNRVIPRVNRVENISKSPEIVFQPLEVLHNLTIGKAGQGQFLLVLTISHAITDGHSAEVILSDLCGFVAGHTGNGEKALPYSDFVLHQHKPLETTVSDYWSKYLLKTQETHLPVTRETDHLDDFDTINTTIPINVASIDRLCQKHDINLANVCQFAWGVVLRGHLSVDDVCFSYISSERHVPLKGIMTSVGPLIVTLLCSMNLEGATNVIDAVKAVNSDYQESLSHEAELADTLSTRKWSNTVMSFRRRLVQDDESLPGLSCKLINSVSPTNVCTYLQSSGLPASTNPICSTTFLLSSRRVNPI